MAIINQTPAGQPSATVSNVVFDDIGASSGNPIRQPSTAYFQATSPSVAIGFGSSGSGGGEPAPPTIGQVYPRGYN